MLHQDNYVVAKDFFAALIFKSVLFKFAEKSYGERVNNQLVITTSYYNM